MPKRHTKRPPHRKKTHKKSNYSNGFNLELFERSLKTLEKEAAKACKTWNLKWPQEWVQELKGLKKSDIYRSAQKQQQTIKKDLQAYTRKITRSLSDIVRLNSRVSHLERQLKTLDKQPRKR